MEDTTQYIKVNGKIYVVMSEELFDLKIKLAYIDGQVYAYKKVEELRGD